MESTGDIGGTDNVEHCAVVAHLPGSIAFAHIAVQVDQHKVTCETAMAIDDEVRFGEKYAGSMPTVCREK
jgi:hypothetical protein